MSPGPDDVSSPAPASKQPTLLETRPAASVAVRREWVRRIEAEYTSSAHTAELALWLIRLGAPRELIDDALRIVSDELDHAELSAAVCAEAGELARPALSRERLVLPVRGDDLAEQVLSACLEVFCLGETVAVPLFVELRRACTVAVARQALDRIVRDEVRHRQFGWDLLEYLLDLHRELRQPAQRHLVPALERLRNRYGSWPEREVSAPERAWGLMPPGTYREILKETWEKEYRPRFEELGLHIEAW